MNSRPFLLRACERGAVALEFALIAPVLTLMLVGLFEVGHGLYTRTQLQGAIQNAARSSTIEGAGSKAAQIDQAVTAAVRAIMPSATLTFNRKSYASFSNVAQPEDFKDLDGNGTCNNGEQFEDANGNGTWDLDRGRTGFGGARDVVLYSVGISYPRTFGAARMFGFSENVQFTATTVLRNQPFDAQTTYATNGNCP